MPQDNNKIPFIKYIYNIILEGLLLLLPVGLTIYIVYIIFTWIYKLLYFSINFVPESIRNFPYINYITELIAIFGIFLILFLIGLITKSVLGSYIQKIIDKLLNSLPIVSPLYTALRQLSLAFLNPTTKEKLSKPVLVEYPRKGLWVIAFLTNSVPEKIKPDKSEEYYTLFMPSTPNPTTGFFFIAKKEDVKILNISIEEAVKIIMSGGLLKE